VLILLGLGICTARLHTYREPLERDITFYAVIARELRAGQQLYSDLWEHYPPAISTTYLTAQVLVGDGLASIYFLGVAAALITLGGVYKAAAAAGGGRQAGLLAAATWAVVSGDLALQANQPNTEVFINACLIWAFALLVANDHGTLSPPKCLAVGVLLALATLYKHVALAAPAALLGAHWLLPSDTGPDRRRALGQALLVAATVAASWLAVLLHITLTGRFIDFWDNVVLFSVFWAGSVRENLNTGLSLNYLYPPFLMGAVAPLVVTAALGVLLGVLRKPTRAGVMLLAYALATEFAILLPGKFYGHYYQFWLPVLVVAAAWAVARLSALVSAPLRMGSVPNHLFFSAASAILLGALLLRQVPNYTLPAAEWPLRKYGKYGKIFVDTERVGHVIGRLLAPNETFYEWGKETGLYFYSRRRMATGVMFLEPLRSGSVKDALERRVVGQLERNPPELFVTHPHYALEDRPIVRWVLTRYERVDQDLGAAPFVLYYRRGGALESRLRSR
jgi:hypothetical protein